ncbi:MAG: zinc ribbon domain-containing protein [Armatimonadetes bacterium]|nr:zinc ribbon domain-containing protein [Armatimonadota bacterium]
MGLFGPLMVLAGVAAAFFLGQALQHRGHSYLGEMERLIPADVQSTVKAIVIALGSLVLLFLISVIFSEGPEAFVPFFFISLWLLTTTWVYLDAKERGGRAKAWAMLTFFTFVFGLCGYLITRPEKPRACPRCAYKLRDEFVVCPYCGPQAGLSCVHCQAVLEPTWRYCPYCQAGVVPHDASPSPDLFSTSQPDSYASPRGEPPTPPPSSSSPPVASV